MKLCSMTFLAITTPNRNIGQVPPLHSTDTDNREKLSTHVQFVSFITGNFFGIMVVLKDGGDGPIYPFDSRVCTFGK